MAQLSPTSGSSDYRAEESKCYIKRMQAETVVGLPWAADSCPWVGACRWGNKWIGKQPIKTMSRGVQMLN